ncbi:MAG: DUF6174 domain-containing protein [Longimicrobiales bacterium]
MRTTFSRFGSPLAGLLASVLAAGCFDPSPTGPTLDDAQRQLDESRALWDAAALANYDIDYQRVCACLPQFLEPVVLQIRDDTVHAVLELTGGEPIQDPPPNFYLTVDEIFDLLQDAIDGRAERIRAQFDPELGYPFLAQVDYQLAVGADEVEVRVANLQATTAE